MTILGARRNVSRWYMALHTWHSEHEIAAIEQGRYADAAVHHTAALAVAWGLTSEMEDREPPPRPTKCPCAGCSQYVFRQFQS